MTATTVSHHFATTSAPRRVRPHGLDRVIMRLSLMALLWARRHAESTAVTHDVQARLFSETHALQRREHTAALLAARVR